MSFLFDKRIKKALRVIWVISALIIILGMVVFFSPGVPEWLMGFLMY